MALIEKSKSSISTTSKYNVAHSDKLGRYLQAAKDLAAGEVILREKPLVVGPIISNKDYVCFACLRFLPKVRKMSQYLCSKCNIAPLCGSICEKSMKHYMNKLKQSSGTDEILLKTASLTGECVARKIRCCLPPSRIDFGWSKKQKDYDGISSVQKATKEILVGEKEESKYHTTDECEILKNNQDLSSENIEDIIGVLLPLRLWLLKQRDPGAWGQVESMEAHMHKRRNTSVWKDREINVINVIKALNLIPDHDASTSELLQQLCGILDVNVFELRSPGGVDGHFLRGLYMVASIMAHDCRGNTHLTVDHNFQLTVYASLPIQQGETVFFNYTSSFLGTSGRREHLRGGKYFECECSLCKDPYEMGSYMSSILCPQCRQGYIGIENPLAINPYEKSMRWQCNRCRRSIGGRLVRTTLNISRTLVEDTDDSDVKSLETLATKLIRSFHPNHFVMLSLKQKLLAAYRKEMATPNPSKKCMQRMLETCKEVRDVLEIVEPGISRLKAIMLYEMHLPLMLLANRAYAAREISLAELSSRLEEAGSLLKRSLGMLLLEPVETPEGKLAKRALHELKALNQNIADVKMITAVEDKCTHNKRKSSKHKSNTNK